MNYLWGSTPKKAEYKNIPYIQQLPKDKAEEFQNFKKICLTALSKILNGQQEKFQILSDDDRLVRFFIGKQFNQKVAFEAWHKWAEWFVEYRPDKLRGTNEKSEAAKNFVILTKNVDKNNKETLYLKLAPLLSLFCCSQILQLT